MSPKEDFRHGMNGVCKDFLAYAFPTRLPDPHHLAVLARPGVVRADCHPPRHLPAAIVAKLLAQGVWRTSPWSQGRESRFPDFCR